MKTHLKVAFVSLIALSGAALLAGCGSTGSSSGTASSANGSSSAAATSSTTTTSKKIGVVLIGDETEGYSARPTSMASMKPATETQAFPIASFIRNKIQEDDGCKTAIDDLVSEDCGLIISNSYGHQDYMAPAAKANPDVTFISMTGDYAAVSKI
jgi:basic membrane protein A